MADVQRYRSGPIAEVRSRVKVGTQIDVGDLVLLNASGEVETVGALTSANFRTNFLGVVVQGHTTGSESTNQPCLVYWMGEFEYPLSAAAGAAVNIGSFVKATADQIVATGGIPGAAGTGDVIARLARRVEVGDTTALIKLESVIMAGGAQPLT